ncbi:unnamed protein product [Cyprideis torosa]|uniref:Uncharacterized protein n=1 Tax=Cyprideis torosa TaxID=163714 RepID=A0A7R8WUV1_9CRUS|nr:unnamed protein product [Cyprideis torosa]CAG0906749.1 unnamed protein product [Cyprideis torosa]
MLGKTLKVAAKRRMVAFVSDRTGLTAEIFGRSLLSQFPNSQLKQKTFAFVDTEEKALSVAQELDEYYGEYGLKPIVFSTVVEEESREAIKSSKACFIDLFNTFIEPLEETLGIESEHTLGLSQKAFGEKSYHKRLDAIDFSLSHDDGVRPDQLGEAELILIGVSRSGKTPTSLYMAMNFSLKVANYPLTDAELESDRLPAVLEPWKEKIAALTINGRTLSTIRQQRRPGSPYASLSVCQKELKAAMTIFQNSQLPVFDSTDISIEEIAGSIVKTLGLLSKSRA